MNNEPVAWIAKTYYPNGLFEEDLVWSKVDENSIPLYTHPVKELTDEEIWEIIDNCFGIDAFNFDYQITLGEARANAFELVKAILRKASE